MLDLVMLAATSASPSPSPMKTGASDGEGASMLLSVGVAFVTAVLTSGALSAFVGGRAARRAERVRQRRRIARRSLDALGAAQVVVNRLGDSPRSVRQSDVAELAARSVDLETAVALTGLQSVIVAARQYRRISEGYVSGEFGVNATDRRRTFEAVVDLLSGFVSRPSGRL